ncbi:hypothetical protein TMSFP069_09030 [Staphylococcus argenteus]|nr:hypothetical protein TMSFP069_09030 [Staphylococcus argenteus]GJF67014.1 hypothetical protein SA19136_07620 [Staphylococcus argenteus]
MGPRHREIGFQFQQVMQVGGGAPTEKLSERQLTIMCELGWGPNTEKLGSNFNKQCKLGWGPNTENFKKKFNKFSELITQKKRG